MSLLADRPGHWTRCLPVLLALLAGCITPAVREEVRVEEASGAETVQETPAAGMGDSPEFDPWRLPESPIRFGDTDAHRMKPAPVSLGRPTPVAPVIHEPDVAAAPDERSAARLADGGTPTWRVQLYSGRSPATADALVAEARLLFPEHTVDRVGDQADLKVLVGHFGSADSAAGLKQRAVRLGFAQAWVVDTGPETAP